MAFGVPSKLLLDSFVTCVAGDGDPYVKVQFPTLEQAQMLHLLLVTRSTWHSIETAPRDGTRVLISDPDHGVSIARFNTESGQWSNKHKPTKWQPLPDEEFTTR